MVLFARLRGYKIKTIDSKTGEEFDMFASKVSAPGVIVKKNKKKRK